VNSRSYMETILPDVRRRLAERKAEVPQSRLQERMDPVGRASLAAALRRPNVSVIAEVKRFSPSKGPIRPDLDVLSLVGAYEAGGAAAISVLTETDHFRGSTADLETAVEATGLPVLRKDFVIDPYQLFEARALGASAVLLIAAILDDKALRSLSTLAAELSLDVLLEVHDGREMARALDVGSDLIGINNRDLRTFEVSIETSLRLAPLAPPGTLLVAESGIRDRSDVERLGAAGIDAVLVGESLLQHEEVRGAVSALTQVPVGARRGRERRCTEES
jgi:indole-3-glycerol phosphate synthase